ncbi:MAG: hypothetical protein Fur0037_12150 [Planctomycetota bacterium]
MSRGHSNGLDLRIEERVLDSGLTLLAVQNPNVATFACAVSLDVRAGDEPRDKAGLVNLVGECLDEGTSGKSALELAEAAESIGGALEGNQRGGSIHCPAEHRKAGMELLFEIVSDPAFPAREVERVKGEIRVEIRIENEDPRTVARRRFSKEVYGRHPLGRPPQGTTESVARIRPRDLRQWHRAFFAPANGYVAAAGPEDPGRMLDLMSRIFGRLKGEAPSHGPIPAIPWPSRPRDVHVPMKREQVHVFVGHRGIRRTDPDYYALSVMDHVLGTGPGFTSRCARRLRDEQGLCYSVAAGITPSAGEEPGTFTAYIGTSPEHREAAIAGFLEEIDRIRETLAEPDEVEAVKDYLTGSFVFGLERNINLAAYAIRARRFDLGFDHVRRYPDLVRAVTAEQVREVARRHLVPSAMIRVSAGAS